MTRRLAAIPIVAVVATLVIGIGVHDARATSTSAATGATAIRTVRDYLADAALDNNGYVSCRYLTAAAAGPDADCSDAVIAAPPSMPGLDTDTRLHKVDMTATVRGGVAYVHVLARGDGAFTVVLTHTTPSERTAFDAPASAWRIASFR